MKRSMMMRCIVLVLAFVAYQNSAWATPTPGYTLSATNLTMSNSGTNSVTFTATSVNGFAGEIVVGCIGPNPPAGVKEPICDTGPVAHAYTLTANGTATGGFELVAYPQSGQTTANHSTAAKGAIWFAAGVLVLGLGLRRRRLRSGMLLLAMGTLVGLTGVSGCSTAPTLTPGTYTYTVSGSEVDGSSTPVTTTFQVTVPAGILLVKGIVE